MRAHPSVFLAAIILSCRLTIVRGSDYHWGYENVTLEGTQYVPPESWFSYWNGTQQVGFAACGPSFASQSPIDISTIIAAEAPTAAETASHRRLLSDHSPAPPVSSSSPSGNTYAAPHRFSAIKFANVNHLSGLSVENNGHDMQVNVRHVDGHYPEVSGGGTEDAYNIERINFHWGNTSTEGSEHTFDLQHSPLEMHIVTWRAQFHTMNVAVSATDGLAVFGVMFEMSEHCNPELQKVLDQIGTGKVLLSGSKATLTSAIDLNGLLPKNWGSYYAYHGSLTTPPCFGSVLWHLFSDKTQVCKEQMKTIRTLSISKSNPQLTIGANNRPLQPRKNRRVWFYDAHPAAGHHAASTCQDDPFLIPFLAMVLLTFIIVSISMYIWLAEGKRPCAQPPWDPKSWDSHGESHSGGHGH